MSGAALLPFIGGAIYSLVSHDPKMAEGFALYGWPASMQVPIMVLELVCALIYLIPASSVLGAILLTGYLGGAIATHVRIGELNVALQLILGVLLWGGLYLRSPLLQKLIPLRRS